MGETNKNSSPPHQSNPEKQPLHPAYTVTNINNKIRTLDGKKVTYSSWVKLFKLHARAYKVLQHIDGTEPPAKADSNYPAWSELDALILQWIYSTLSDELLARVLDTDLTARAAWLQIQEIFVNNKHARAVTLETKFTNTTLSSCSSFNDYCQTLQDIAEQLRDVDQPVNDSRLVIQMVRGLPVEYDTIAAIINQSKPTWDVARSMIEDEQNRLAARPQQNRDTVLVHTGATPNTDSVRSPYPNGYRGKNYDPAKAARGREPSTRGGRNIGNRPANAYTQHGPSPWGHHSNQTNQQTPTHLSHYPQTNHTQHYTQSNQPPHQHQNFNTPSWTPPPTPYPSQPAHYQSHHQAHLTHQPTSTTTPSPGFDQHQQNGNALCPSDIGVALSYMQLNYTDPQWNMDTGASSHITSNPGPQGWTLPFPPQ